MKKNVPFLRSKSALGSGFAILLTYVVDGDHLHIASISIF
jgi:hypothetical protein